MRLNQALLPRQRCAHALEIGLGRLLDDHAVGDEGRIRRNGRDTNQGGSETACDGLGHRNLPFVLLSGIDIDHHAGERHAVAPLLEW